VEVNAGPDSLVWYHTGAASTGAAQTDQAASLGGLRSSTRIATRSALITDNIADVVVEFVGMNNATGKGYLRADTTSTLAYTAPGDTEGTAVSIADTETKIITSGDGISYLKVRRRSTTNLSGLSTIKVAWVANNAIAMTDAAKSSGATYRQVSFKNEGLLNINNLRFWITTSGPRIALEAPDINDETQEIADEDTAPTAVTWSSASTRLTGLHLPLLEPGDEYRLWIERASAMVATETPSDLLEISHTFDIYEG